MAQKGSLRTSSRRNSLDHQRNNQRFRRANVSEKARGGGDRNTSPRRERMKEGSSREKARKAELRRKKIKESTRTRKIEIKEGSRLDYSFGIRTKRDQKDNGGVRVAGIINKIRNREGGVEQKRMIQINEINLSQNARLIDTIEVFKEVRNEDALGRVVFNMNGIENIETLIGGLNELKRANPNVDVGFIFKDKDTRYQRLNEGFAGVAEYINTADGRPVENDAIDEIGNYMVDMEARKDNLIRSIDDIKEMEDHFNGIQFYVDQAERELQGGEEIKFLQGLKAAIGLQVSREREKLHAEEMRIAMTPNIIFNKIESLRREILAGYNNEGLFSDFLKITEPLTGIVLKAGLTTDEIDKLFNSYDVASPTQADPNRQLTFGGQISELLSKSFSRENIDNATESIFGSVESDLRDQMAIALNQLGKSIKAEDLPEGFFTKKYLNNDPPDSIVIPKEGKIERIIKWVKREKKKGKKIDGDLKPFNSATASDVYTVTTEGNIGFSGTNEGFAKKAINVDAPYNDTTRILSIGEADKKLTEDPKLIARQVISSRIDKKLKIFILADEVFARDDQGIIGITAKVSGKSIFETKEVEEGDTIVLYRNFDFSNPNTQKGLSDLQIMDAITGQQDRHGGNIFIDPKTGRVYGIDNDAALKNEVFNDYGGNSLVKQFEYVDGKLVYNQEQIDKTTAEKILKMDRSELKTILEGKDSDPKSERFSSKSELKSIENALERFDAIKRKIEELKGRKPSALIEKWTIETYRKALEDREGVRSDFNYKNYAQRSVAQRERVGTDLGRVEFNEIKAL